MLDALPCFNDGVVSFNGGMIRTSGMLAMRDRKDVEMNFHLISGECDVLPNYTATKDVVEGLHSKDSMTIFHTKMIDGGRIHAHPPMLKWKTLPPRMLEGKGIVT